MAQEPSLATAVRTGPALAAQALASCPLCHTASSFTEPDVAHGQSWHCERCGQRWDRDGLAGAATYAVWIASRRVPRGG